MQISGSMVAPASGDNTAIFLQSLKSSTAAQHSRLESQILLSAIMQPGVTPQQYYYYLLLMREIEDAYQQHVLPMVHFLFPTDVYNTSLPLLQHDTGFLEHTTPPKVANKFSIDQVEITIPFALGFMYVMEGSKLGGRVIYKHIHTILGYTNTSGASFLYGNGGHTGGHWKNFLHHFAGYVIDENIEAATSHGAQWAFTSIYQFFESNRHLYAV